MNIKEKLGDLFVDLAKLVFGGVILASIISEEINTLLLYAVGVVSSLSLAIIGFTIYKYSKRKD